MEEIECPVCGRLTLKAKYCAFCGAELTPKSGEVAELEELPDEVVEQLRLRIRMEEIAGELASLKGEIDELVKQISEGHDVEKYRLKVKELREKAQNLKNERERLAAEIKPFPLEDVAKKRSELEERILRLDAAHGKGEVSDEVYAKLRKEYEGQLDALKRSHFKEIALVEKWIDSLKRKIKKLTEEAELLYARHIAGEIPEESYMKEKGKLESELKESRVYAEMLELILRKWS